MPGRLCPALAESAGQLPGHRHRRGRGGHCIPATTSAHPSKHQFPDQEQPTRPSASRRCLADEGSHRASHQREVPGFLQSVVSRVGVNSIPELELQVNSNSNSGIGIGIGIEIGGIENGIGIEIPGIGIGIGIENRN